MARPRTKQWADTLEQVQAHRTMDVTLLSGLKVTLRTVNLDELAVAEAIPGDLLVAAILDSGDMLLPTMWDHVKNDRTDEAQKLARDILLLRERICRDALVSPAPTDELMAALDGFDKQMIVELAQRKRSTDAAGKVVAAQQLGDFAGFRADGDGVTDGEAGGAVGKVADAVA